jgi:hypothetical protein
MTSVMRHDLAPAEDLSTMLEDLAPVESQAERLRGRRLVVVGTGTTGMPQTTRSGCSARPASTPPRCRRWTRHSTGRRSANDAVVVMSHRNTKRFSTEVLERERGAGAVPVVVIGGRGSPASTSRRSSRSAARRSPRATSAALMRLLQLTVALGGTLEG